MCESTTASLVSSIIVGVLTGFISSAAVSIFFYFQGRKDADKVSRNSSYIAQLDQILLILAFYDPTSEKGRGGRDDTHYILECWKDVMKYSKFNRGASCVAEISQKVKNQPLVQREQSEEVKEPLRGEIRDIRDSLLDNS